MASFVRNMSTKNYQNLKIVFQVTVKNVGNVFETQCTYLTHSKKYAPKNALSSKKHFNIVSLEHICSKPIAIPSHLKRFSTIYTPR